MSPPVHARLCVDTLNFTVKVALSDSKMTIASQIVTDTHFSRFETCNQILFIDIKDVACPPLI